MASIVCEQCSKAYSDKEGSCYRAWHDVKGETLPPHEPLSQPMMVYPCPEDLPAPAEGLKRTAGR